MLAGERNQLLVGALGAAEDVDALSRKRFALRTRNARRWSLITKGYTQNIALHVGHCAPGYPSGLDPKAFIVGPRATYASLPPSYVLTARFALPLWLA